MTEALRQAAQAALDALESDAIQRTFAGGVRMSNAAIALRAALAQPPAPTAQPAATKVLIERLHARTESPPCNADGTYTVGNCRPDALCQEAATEIERLCAAVALFTDNRSKQMLTDHGIAQTMNFRSLNGGNDDSPWWLLFARDIERLTRQHCALERMTEDAQRLGMYDDNPKAAGWKEGFIAGNDWRQSVDEFWRTHDYGEVPTAPSNPYGEAQPVQQPGAEPMQGGMDNAELLAAWKKKLPGVEPSATQLTAFAVGVEVGFAHARDLERQDWSRVHHALAKHGVHPGRTDDHLADVIDRALASPAQRQPLSDEEIEAIWKAHVLPGFGERQRFYSPVVYARAIESAHGIAAQKGEKL